jgi:hypothetical protein
VARQPRIRATFTGDKGRKQEIYLTVEIRLNALTILNYWNENYDSNLQTIEWNDLHYSNFHEYLAAVIYREFFTNFNRIFAIHYSYEELEIFFDESEGSTSILQVIEKNHIWERYAAKQKLPPTISL